MGVKSEWKEREKEKLIHLPFAPNSQMPDSFLKEKLAVSTVGGTTKLDRMPTLPGAPNKRMSFTVPERFSYHSSLGKQAEKEKLVHLPFAPNSQLPDDFLKEKLAVK